MVRVKVTRRAQMTDVYKAAKKNKKVDSKKRTVRIGRIRKRSHQEQKAKEPKEPKKSAKCKPRAHVDERDVRFRAVKKRLNL
jgi:hypothetical protein